MPRVVLACLCALWVPSSGFMPEHLEHFPSTTLPNGLRRYSHRHEHSVGEGKLFLDWTVHADPKTILSIDAEHGRCVRIAECSKGRLSMYLKESCAVGLEHWRYIVASTILHGCRHMDGHNLYARILDIQSQSQSADDRLVEVDIEELESHAHVVPFMDFKYYYMPHEAMDSSHTAQKKYGQPLRRQLSILSNTGLDANSIGGMRFTPNQVRNFGWNWDFDTNSTKRTEFNYSLPGGDGYVKLFKPFVKAHAGLEINFTSHFSDGQRAPHVQLRVALDGHALLSGKMSSLLRTENDTQYDPFRNLSFPILHELHEPIWLGQVNFSVGGIPISFHPGVRLRATAYHIGQFEGTLQMGLEMQARFRPVLRFDSAIGLDVDFNTKLIDVKLSPPNWNIWTNHFEMGAILEPQLFLQGDFGLMRNASVGLSLKPYMNLTISRESGKGMIPVVKRKPLVVYPLSAEGLPKGRKYAIKVGAGGIFRRSSTQLSLDDKCTLYNDHPEKFLFEPLSEDSLVGRPVTIALLEDGKEPSVSVTEVLCETMRQGECLSADGSPLEARLLLDGQRISVELVVLWSEEPMPRLRQRMRGLELGLPWLVMTQSMSEQLVQVKTALSLRLLQDGQTSSVPLNVTIRNAKVVLTCDRVEHFSPVLWPADLRSQRHWPTLLPKVQLLLGKEVIGEGDLSNFYHEKTHTVLDDIYAQASGKRSGLVPVELTMHDPSDETRSIGAGHLSVAAHGVGTASFWIYPYQAVKMKLGAARTLYWTAELPVKESITFHLDAVKVGSVNGERSLGVMSTIHKTIVQRCSFRAGEVQQFGNFENPCVFSTELILTSANVSVGDQISFRVSWKQEKRWHEMLSVPVDVASAPTLPLVEIVQPREGDTITKGNQLSINSLNIAWSHFDVDHEDEDREHFKLHGLSSTACGPDCARSPLPPNLTVSISTAGPNGTEVFRREDIDPQEWWTHVPSDNIQGWEDGAYEICLSWGEDRARCKQRRSIHVTSQQASERVLQAIDWSASDGPAIAKGAHCRERPLEYKLGAGVLVQGILQQSGMPEGLPILGALLEAPNFDTGFVPISAASTHQKELREILPEIACAGGVCSGKLPGCQLSQEHALHIAKIQFNVSRPVHWVPDAPFMIRDAVAFGLSLLPEAVHVLKIRSEHAGMVADLQFAAESLLGVKSECYDINAPGCVGRRLNDITADHVFSSFTVGIQAPLRKEVDDQFLTMLVQHQAFDQISDGFEGKLGGIRVVGFSLEQDSMDSNTGSDEIKLSDVFEGTGPWFVFAMAAVVSATFGLNVVFKKSFRSSGGTGEHNEASKPMDSEAAHATTKCMEDQCYIPVNTMDP